MTMQQYDGPTAVEMEAEIKRLEDWRHGSAGDHDGYCRHGAYVGGCGIDWMCGTCENYSLDEEIAAIRESIKLLEETHRFDSIEGVYPPGAYHG